MLYTAKNLLEDSGKHLTGKVIDYGAGTCRLKKLILKNADEYFGFDKIDNKNLDAIGDVLDSKLPDNTFDNAICIQVIEHIRNPYKLVSELHRILKPNGHCIITAPFLAPFHPDPIDNFRFTKEGLSAIAEDCGFQVIKQGSFGNPVSVISSMIRFTYFSPYKKYRKGSYRINKILSFISGLFPLNKIIYSGSYIICKK